MVFEWLAQMDGIYVSQSIDIMLVCKHWTDVALNTAALWQMIPERARVDWFAVALARSKNMLVDIFANASSLLSVAPLLVKEAYRLRTLDTLRGDADPDNTDSDVAGLLEDTIFAVAEFPHLETFAMKNPGLFSHKLASFCNPDRFPALQILDIAALYVPWDSSVFRQLRVLQIVDVFLPQSDSVPISVFLDVLKTCQCLETLHFIYVSFIDYTGHEQIAADFIVSLPSLVSFCWFWPSNWAFQSPTDVYRLLEHLHLPTSVDVHLQFDVVLYTEDEPVTDPHDEYSNISYLKMFPPDTGRLPILSAVRTARFRSPVPGGGGEWAHLYCTGWGDDESFQLSFVNGQEPIKSSFPYPANQQFCDFLSLFDETHLQSLTADLLGLDIICLRRAFNYFPYLKTLELLYQDFDSRCWGIIPRYLFIALTDPSHHEDGDVTANLLGLRHLSLENLVWSEHAFCVLFAALVVRTKQGAPRLSSLRVKVGEGGFSRGERIPDRDAIAALQAMVDGPVEYVDTTVYGQSMEEPVTDDQHGDGVRGYLVSRKETGFKATNNERGSLTVTVTNRQEDGWWAYRVDDQLRNFCEIFFEENMAVRKITIET
ncbi:hypothetical protein TRAPUB_12398 [Trametes pubescens]|uniref:F-box domain-containing protein n=1 Tax=Trametes pubescens TaxID=154538 RepID=A0A1M2VU29_TRAPU|nr:hypothetical protein TRAPUB_12398 [Trametes pubescens]